MKPLGKIITAIPGLETGITENLYNASPKQIKKALKKIKREKELDRYRDLLAIYGKVASGQIIKNVQSRSLTILNGRDTAGKGGTITRMGDLDKKVFGIVALEKPTDDDVARMKADPSYYFQRYENPMSEDKNVWIGDRSCYNRGLVEPVMGFCTEQEHQDFLNGQVQEFERKRIIEKGYDYTKIYLSITPETQLKRLKNREDNPRKHHKLSLVDREAPNKTDEYTLAKVLMLEKTDTTEAPWTIIDSNNKHKATIECIKAIVRANQEVKEVVEAIIQDIGLDVVLTADSNLVRTVPEEFEEMKKRGEMPTRVKSLDYKPIL